MTPPDPFDARLSLRWWAYGIGVGVLVLAIVTLFVLLCLTPLWFAGWL